MKIINQDWDEDGLKREEKDKMKTRLTLGSQNIEKLRTGAKTMEFFFFFWRGGGGTKSVVLFCIFVLFLFNEEKESVQITMINSWEKLLKNERNSKRAGSQSN
jgi:hypothetical protein